MILVEIKLHNSDAITLGPSFYLSRDANDNMVNLCMQLPKESYTGPDENYEYVRFTMPESQVKELTECMYLLNANIKSMESSNV